jgi:hypothetical protein
VNLRDRLLVHLARGNILRAEVDAFIRDGEEIAAVILGPPPPKVSEPPKPPATFAATSTTTEPQAAPDAPAAKEGETNG